MYSDFDSEVNFNERATLTISWRLARQSSDASAINIIESETPSRLLKNKWEWVSRNTFSKFRLMLFEPVKRSFSFQTPSKYKILRIWFPVPKQIIGISYNGKQPLVQPMISADTAFLMISADYPIKGQTVWGAWKPLSFSHCRYWFSYTGNYFLPETSSI